MVSVKPVDRLSLADLWREVPLEEEFWEQARERQRRLLKVLLEGALEEEQVELLAAGRYRRVESRRGYRNGFYERDLVTQIGIVTGIRVPRARQGGGESQVFSRYQRRQAQVDRVIREVFLAGVSTRRVGEALGAMLGERVSAQTVSRMARSLDREVRRFHRAPLADDVRYLLLDAVSMRIRSAAEVKRRLVLCAYAITVMGERRLVDFRLAKSESQAAWEAFLNQLRERGRLGRHLRLVTTDGCLGLHDALEVVYPYIPRQHLLGTQAAQCGQQAAAGPTAGVSVGGGGLSTRPPPDGRRCGATGPGHSAGGWKRPRLWPAWSRTWRLCWPSWPVPKPIARPSAPPTPLRGLSGRCDGAPGR